MCRVPAVRRHAIRSKRERRAAADGQRAQLHVYAVEGRLAWVRGRHDSGDGTDVCRAHHVAHGHHSCCARGCVSRGEQCTGVGGCI